MKLSNLKKANTFEVQEWLESGLDLTPYQKEKMRNTEMIRFSKFEFYQRDIKKATLLWRLTVIFYLPYIIASIMFLPIKFLLTGNWYMYRKQESFHLFWIKKIGL